MRITTYEKGGNSLNPFIKLFIFLIILGLFIMPVSAFEDDFNDDDMTDWIISSGTWSTSNFSSIEGVNDYYAYNYISSGVVTNDIYKLNNIEYNYYEFDLLSYGSDASSLLAQTIFVFESNGVDERSIALCSYTNIAETHHYIEIIGDGFTFTNTVIVDGSSFSDVNKWFHFEISLIGTNIKIDVYDDTNTLVLTQTNPYTRVSGKDRFIARNDVNDYAGGEDADNRACFDNIYMSGTTPSIINGIEWDLEQYIEGDTASYTWALQNTFWQNLIYKYRIQILKDGIEIDTVRVSQTGTRYYEVNTAGTYEVKLQYSGLIFTNWQSIDSDSVNVIPQADSFINVPKIAEQKTNFTINYLYGTTPPTAAIFIKKLNEELEEYILYDIIYLDGGIVNTEYSQNISIWGEGFYKLILYNANIPEQDLKTDVIQITKIIIPPQTNINTSRIRSQQDTYSKSDVVLGDYAVDFINYTSYVINLELYNYEFDSIVYSETINDQSGVVIIPLYATDLTVFTGVNNIRLSSYSNTGIFIDDIVYDNITINLVDEDGYGLTLSKYEVYTDESFIIKCIVPQLSTIRIINRLTLEEIDNFEVNSSSYINYKISQIGDYEIRLITSSGYVKGNQYIKVVVGTIVDDPLIDEDEIIPDTTFQDNTTSLLNSPYLIGLFIMCVFLAIGAPNGISGMIVTGSISLGIVCYMGIFPWILLVIEVLVVAVLMAKGMIYLSGN